MAGGRLRLEVTGPAVLIVRDGNALRPAPRCNHKVLPLIRYLAYRRDEGSSVRDLGAHLWQDPDAAALVRKTVQRARAMMGGPSTIENRRGGYSLSAETISCDLWDLEDQAEQLLDHWSAVEVRRWLEQCAQVQVPEGVRACRLAERARVLAWRADGKLQLDLVRQAERFVPEGPGLEA